MQNQMDKKMETRMETGIGMMFVAGGFQKQAAFLLFRGGHSQESGIWGCIPSRNALEALECP